MGSETPPPSFQVFALSKYNIIYGGRGARFTFPTTSYLCRYLHCCLISCLIVAEGAGTETRGLFPGVSNLAAHAEVTSNATCGQRGAEVFCRLSLRGSSCGVCDARAPDPGKRHPPAHAVDGSSRWWQSPSLAEGAYDWVTLTLDLKQVRSTTHTDLNRF